MDVEIFREDRGAGDDAVEHYGTYEYEDEPTYRAWTVGFRLTRDTIQGSTDEKEERDPNNHQGEHRVQDRSA
jgi:hypothetical protein